MQKLGNMTSNCIRPCYEPQGASSIVKRTLDLAKTGRACFTRGISAIKRPPFFEASANQRQAKTQNRGFKVVRENMVIVFNVPFPTNLPFSKLFKLCGVMPLADHHSFYINLSLCPFTSNSHLFYLQKLFSIFGVNT